ncbi:hypothetical protein MICA_596 [Micavibrio aeruginosavorus ARL-13]|uniref:Uncharacterized protein n=1 Tax=Micavibrio aeruginosavorus (strain ARL-13) TaxID=856793 RepID=G2KN01_MICAA|nr:hypothetical protein MICA_596 [Micavibrio aeruginosavorus ARL-13]
MAVSDLFNGKFDVEVCGRISANNHAFMTIHNAWMPFFYFW